MQSNSLFSLVFSLCLFLVTIQNFIYNQETPLASYTVIESRVKLPLLNPTFAQTKTLKIRLQNGLEAYLVSDPLTDKSSAVLTVRAGSWAEPRQFPGLAHFLEHMLFLGTKTYPRESDYDRYITQHGGNANAFTASDHTSYLFSIENTAFEEALDRFSRFFKEPLFNPSGVMRELRAIDQEYAKNRENDDIREFFVYKELANATHPFHAFSTGNSQTLAKVSQATLKEWYHTHYTANLMRLVVISPLALDQLKELVIADFKDIPTNKSPPLDLNLPIFSPELAGKIVYIEPIKNLRRLTLSWDLPARFAHQQDAKPEAIACYLLGHEGKESLLAHLKKENFAEQMDCGFYQIGPHNSLFFLQLTLTDEGVKELFTVIERVFQAIAKFKETGVPLYIYDDVQRINTISYQYQPREEAFSTVMKQASWLAHEEMASYPEKSQVIQKFDPPIIQDFINQLTPKNCHYAVLIPSRLTKVKPDKVEQWNGVPYAIQPIPAASLQTWTQAIPYPGIDLPPANPYNPSHLELLHTTLDSPSASILPHPFLLVSDEKAKIYYAPDREFLTPQVSFIFEIKTPEIQAGEDNQVVMGDLLITLLNEALKAESYPALMAGLNYALNLSDNGIILELTGYSENASTLLETILKQIKDFVPNSSLFKIYKDSQLRNYQNFALEPPLQQASAQLKKVIYKHFTTESQKARALKKITFELFQDYVKRVFQKTAIQGLIYGNINESEAKKVTALLNTTFDGAAYPKEEQLVSEVLILPQSKGPFYIEQKIKVEGNAAILAIQNPQFSHRARAAQQVLMQAISEPFFAELRTKQQTGYIVFNSADELERCLFDFFAVQSTTHEARDLLARFELFIEGYLHEIETEVPKERFAQFKQALIENLKKPAKNIKEMGVLLNNLAFKYEADFDWIDRRLLALTELSYEEFMQEAQKFLGKSNTRRLAILMKGLAQPDQEFSYRKLANPLSLHHSGLFKTADSLYKEGGSSKAK